MEAVPNWGTVPRMVRSNLAADPAAVVLADSQGESTLAEVADAGFQVGRALISHGIGRGDRVAIIAPNQREWVTFALGCWNVGAILVPLSTRAKGIENGSILKQTGCRLVMVVEGFLGTSLVDQLATFAGGPALGRPFEQLPELETVVVCGVERGGTGLVTWTDFLAKSTETSVEVAEAAAASVTPQDPIEILSTSGTTGHPKGVVLCGQQVLRSFWDWSEVVGLERGDRYPIVSPFAHGFGVNAGLLACLMRRATMIPIAIFDPDAAFDIIESQSISIMAGPPGLFSRLLGRPDLALRDLTSLRVAIVGAAAVPTELISDITTRLGFAKVVNAYGLIEGSTVTMTRSEDSLEIVASSAGRVMPGMEVRLVADAGHDVSAGEPGEVLVRGHGVMKGYWNQPERTQEALDPEGWLHTGDIGVLSSEGNLSIVDRKKDMFIVGGFNAYPAEIENLLTHHPQVEQVAVVAVDDDQQGQVAWAYMVKTAGAALTESSLIEWARTAMSNYKVPRRILIVDELPVSANGKIDKGALRSRAASAKPT